MTRTRKTRSRMTLSTALAVSLLTGAFITLAGCGGTQTRDDQAAPAEARPTGEAQMPTVTLPDDRSMTVSFSFAFRAGSTDDPAKKEGLTALTAALTAESGTVRRTYAQVLEALFPLAAGIGWSVDRDLTTFTGRVHVDHLEAYYEIFRNVLLAPRMDAQSFGRLKQKAESYLTLQLRTQDDEELGKAVLQAMIYEGHPYGHPDIGTASGLASITLEDVKAHRERVFCRERVTIGLAGAVPEGFAARVEADLQKLPACQARPAPLPKLPPVPANEVWLVEKPTAASTAISFGFATELNRDHPDYAALYLVTSWLGQHRNSVSHLFKKIREERGLNYGDYAYIEWWPHGGRTTEPPVNAVRRQQFFHVWIRPVPHETRLFALRAAVRELAALSEKGLTAGQFADIRQFISNYVAFYTITEERRLGYAIDDHFLGLEKPSLDTLRTAWSSLTLEQVNAAIKRHLHADRLQIAVITKDAESMAKAMIAGDPSPITYSAPKPPAVLEEDKEIEVYPVPVTPEHVRIVPYETLFE